MLNSFVIISVYHPDLISANVPHRTVSYNIIREKIMLAKLSRKSTRVANNDIADDAGGLHTHTHTTHTLTNTCARVHKHTCTPSHSHFPIPLPFPPPLPLSLLQTGPLDSRTGHQTGRLDIGRDWSEQRTARGTSDHGVACGQRLRQFSYDCGPELFKRVGPDADRDVR